MIPATRKEEKDDTALPICTRESINYTSKCISCKEEGRKRIYWGESSRSSNQRGVEHFKEIGVQTHPMVLHFLEEHTGERQDFLMRVTKYHKKAVERQILKSIRILGGNKNPQESLNLKSEWAAARLPTISVRKGAYQPGNKKEDKRIRYVEGKDDSSNQETDEQQRQPRTPPAMIGNLDHWSLY